MLSQCKPTQPQSTIGVVLKLKGQASAQGTADLIQLKVGDSIKLEQSIHTGPNSVAIVQFGKDGTTVEIQSNSIFHTKEFSKTSQHFHLEKGNLWLRAKGAPGRQIKLQSTTALAAVRGTKFYTFQFKDPKGRDVYGTCHCEGNVHYEVGDSNYKKEHKQDSVVMTIDGKTILFSPEEAARMTAWGGHNHSELDDSELGPPQPQIPPEAMQKLFSLIDKKLQETSKQYLVFTSSPAPTDNSFPIHTL